MNYRVHRLDVRQQNFQIELEQFLAKLKGEVVSIVPNVIPYFLCYGAKTNYVLIVEKVS